MKTLLHSPHAAFLLAAILLTGCTSPAPSPRPSLGALPPTASAPPQPLSSRTPLLGETDVPPADPSPTLIPVQLVAGNDGAPLLKVYIVSAETIEEMPIETYLQGVLAGEMKNDWPMEALKAQAIIARTFALKFIGDKGGSVYPGADVSTDVTEAQAYDAAGINSRVREAIEATRGLVITYDGELAYTWFHSHAGGITAMAKEGLEWEKEEPPYIHSVPSAESPNAPANVAAWSASFPMESVRAALTEMGFRFPALGSISIGERGPSGRVTTFDIDGTPVTAPSLRVRLGASVFKSTLLTHAAIEGGNLVLRGSGYGHGVGLSQWGAYDMAERGSSAQEIIEKYYTGVAVEKLW